MGIIERLIEKSATRNPPRPAGEVAREIPASGLELRPCVEAATGTPTNGNEPQPGESRTQPGEDSGPGLGGHSDPADQTRSRRISVDIDRLRLGGFLTPDADASPVAPDFRRIKRPLLNNAFGKGAAMLERGNLIMVTSALPGEGKTFTAANLALSMATEVDRTVLLVDADVLRPSIAGVFGVDAVQGLTDLLLEEVADLSDVLLKTNIPKLTLLPAGRRHHLSTELLASEAMARIALEFAERYADRVVIFDSPPLLAATEAAVLATLMGQIIMVVEAEKTPQSAVTRALELLDSKAALGLVLNKDHRRFGKAHYYGYY